MAPEVLKHKYYNSNADIWSLGVLLYEMLHGRSIFKGARMHDTIANILRSVIYFEEYVKEDAREVISVILNKDYEERPKACEILDSAWARRIEAELHRPETVEDCMTECVVDSPKSSENKSRKSVTESIEAIRLLSTTLKYEGENVAKKEVEERPKKILNLIHSNIAKLIKAPRYNRVRNNQLEVHSKLVKGMFLTNAHRYRHAS
jgi:serine/threonine protein kinase